MRSMTLGMTTLTTTLMTALTAGASAAGAQSASVQFLSPAQTVAPGAAFPVDLTASYVTGAAQAGFFGAPGFYGFGGDIVVDSGPAGSVQVISTEINPDLFSGQFLEFGNPPLLFRSAAGRGLESALDEIASPAVAFELFVQPGTPDGPLTLRFDGTVVLSLGDDLVTYSTMPGVNQSTLDDITFTIEIVTPPPCVADLTTTGATLAGQPGFGVPDGAADLDDLGFFLNAWLALEPVADFTTTGATLEGQPGFGAPDGAVDLDDLGYFLNFWLSGCP